MRVPQVRRVWSVSNELLHKSREAALSAVQIFNNPQIQFKSELFIVTMCIAWTYLLHSYYRKHGIEYRYFRLQGRRRRFDKTKWGAFKHWELERCINDAKCPLDKDTCNNLRLLIELRNEIEHQMTTRMDDSVSAKFQACCLNYNHHIKSLFDDSLALDKHLAISLQFSHINKEQVDLLTAAINLPSHIQSCIDGFESGLSHDEFNSPKFAYRVLFIAKTANRKGQADQVIEVVKSDTELAKIANRVYIKEIERKKFRAGQIVSAINLEDYKWFNISHHTKLWKELDAKNPGKGYGVKVADGEWYWYENWLERVREFCKDTERTNGRCA